MAGNNLPWVPRINATKVVTVTPTISSSPAYTAGDQLGGIMTLTDVIRQDSNGRFGTSELVEVTILDGSKQDSAIDIWLFNQSPTVTSVDNGAFAMTYANMQSQAIGVIQIGTSGTYSDASATSMCSAANLNIPVQVANTASSPTNIYAIAVARGTPTYATTTSLTFLFKFFMD
jgi:hypothetical protein